MILEVERKDLPEDTSTYEFDRVLFVGDLEDGPKVGNPTVDGAKVTAAVMAEIMKVVSHGPSAMVESQRVGTTMLYSRSVRAGAEPT